MRSPLHILIAEDHSTVREGLKMLINRQSDMKTVGEAADGREAIDLARKLEPDVVLMDISMPELNGLKAAATLKRVQPDVKIVVLTRHTDEAYMKELFQAGVSGYVLKQSPSDELTRAVRAVAKGDNFLDPAMTSRVFDEFGSRRSLRGENRMELSAREEDVLRYIAFGYSLREIAEKLDTSSKTVESQKISAMQKLKISSRRQIVRYAILRGWMSDT